VSTNSGEPQAAADPCEPDRVVERIAPQWLCDSDYVIAALGRCETGSARWSTSPILKRGGAS